MRATLLVFLVACRASAIQSARAQEIGIVPQSQVIQGHDGGSSAVLFGKSVWLYGDTTLNKEDADGINWHSNSFAWTSDLDASNGLDGFEERLDSAGAPVPLVPNTADEQAFNLANEGKRWAQWPGNAVWDAPRNRALIWYSLIYAETGDFNFRGVGSSLAVWSDFSKQAERPTMLFGDGEPGYGIASILHEDFLYAFACDGQCTLARVPAANATERSAWAFWNGNKWSAAMKEAAPLFAGGLGMTLFRMHDQFVLVYSGALSNDVRVRTAEALTGPWSGETFLFKADRKTEGVTYDAYVHPELTKDDTLYVTFTRPNGVGWFGSDTVLVKVDLEWRD